MTFEYVYGVRLIQELFDEAESVVVPIEAWRMRGFVEGARGVSWPVRHVNSNGGPGSIEVDAPAGHYAVGIRIYDAAGGRPGDAGANSASPLHFRLLVNGRPVGAFTASARDNRHYLYFTTERIPFAEGQTVCFEVEGRRAARVEGIVFLPQVPEPVHKPYEIRSPQVRWEPEWPPGAGNPLLRFTWITTWPATGELVIEESTSAGTTRDETARVGSPRVVLPFEKPLQNHALDWNGFEPGARYRWSIVTQTPSGETRTAGPFEVEAFPPAEPKSRAAHATLALPFTNRSQADLVHWPTRTGLPFTKGELGSGREVCVTGPDGREIPCQATVLSRWPDYSVRWLLLEFMADLPAGGTVEYTLHYGRAAGDSPGDAPLITKTATGWRLATGPLQLDLDASDLRLPGRVGLTGIGSAAPTGTGSGTSTGRSSGDTSRETDGGEAVLRLSDGRVFSSAGPPEVVRIEANGPVRGTLYCRGHHRGDSGQMFAYEARLHVFRGSTLVWLEYTFGNDHDEDFTTVESLTLRVPFAGGAAGARAESMHMAGARLEGVRLGGDESPHTFDRDECPVTLRQMTDHEYTIAAGNSGFGTAGRRAPGWVELRMDGRTHTVAVGQFWQNYPKAIAVSEAGVELHLLPAFEPGTYAGEAKDKYERERLFFHIGEGGYRIKAGMSRRHFVLLAFDTPAERVPLEYVHAPLRAEVPRAHLAATQACGPMQPMPGPWTKRFSEKFEAAIKSYLAQREEQREYGWINFGDWWGERGFHWGNLEYDTVLGLLQSYLHTGNHAGFALGVEAALHQMDIDVVRFHREPAMIGAHYRHAMGHVGDYWTEPPFGEGEWWQGGPSTLGHTFNRGLVVYYLLTGDVVALETAKAMADHLMTARYLNAYDCTGYERFPGWQSMLSTAIFEATGDYAYRNASAIIMERVLERQLSNGGWPRLLTSGHCNCERPHIGNVGFMLAVMMQSMMEYYQLTGDERIMESIARGTRYIVEETWIDSAGKFRYTSCPRSPLRNDPRMSGPLAATCTYQDDPFLRRVLLRVLDDYVSHSGSAGKGLSGAFRFVPWALAAADEWEEARR